MAEMKLIPGFRFHPTDVELILYFLKRKVLRKKIPFDVIAEVDIYKYPPWDLPAHSLLKNGDLEWYFFCPRGKKYASGARMNRATEGGYWKTTGKDRSIEHKKLVVGMIKTLVFHTGKAPKGDRTDWVMHEFRLEDKNLSDKGIPQDSYVICKVFQKDGPGPRNGAQYGKPFNEEDWDEEEEIGGVESIPDAQSVPIPIQPTTCDSSVVNDRHPSTSEDDFLGMVDYSKDDDTTALNESTVIEEADNPAHANNGDPNNGEVAPYFDPDEIFVDLGDLDSMVVLGEDGHGHGDRNGEYTPNDMLITADDNLWLSDSHDFLELDDLEAPLFWQNQQGK